MTLFDNFHYYEQRYSKKIQYLKFPPYSLFIEYFVVIYHVSNDQRQSQRCADCARVRWTGTDRDPQNISDPRTDCADLS